jgi:hypothetical protein
VKPFPIDVENRESVDGFKNRGDNVFAGNLNCVSVPAGYNAREVVSYRVTHFTEIF